MAALSRSPRVIQLAHDLGLSTRGDCLGAIRTHARRQIDELVRTSPIPIDTLDTLRRMVANKFRVCLEVIETDADVERIAAEHVGFAPHLHRRLATEFIEEATEGITLEREQHDPVLFRYLVVVDGRGDRAARAYFTAWHELSHLLVHPPQLAMPGFRRTPAQEELERDPLEQVVDHVAGHVAFYEPLFRRAYLGHDAQDMTDRYEVHEIDMYLREDAIRLTHYLETGERLPLELAPETRLLGPVPLRLLPHVDAQAGQVA